MHQMHLGQGEYINLCICYQHLLLSLYHGVKYKEKYQAVVRLPGISIKTFKGT